MSRQTKKPAQQIATKVKNVNLLPGVLATEPNKKMLDSTLDVMTSKGQMLSFNETYGLRSASNKVKEFFVNENNEVRRETQANNMLVMKDSADAYLGKASYLDIDNYFNVKNSPLLDGTVLDKNVNVLDLPVNPYRISDYSLFYWLPNDLPACRIHLDEKTPGQGDAKFSIQNDLIGKTFVTLQDDLTGRQLELQNGMIIFFTGVLDSNDQQFLSVDEDSPATYYVYGVGEFIFLSPTSLIETRIPNSYLKKRPWDKDNPYKDPPAIKWDSERWDGSRIISSEPEYVTQERFSGNSTHWEVIDHWYHITTIRTVANFLGANVVEIISPEDRAKRPIITFYRSIKLYNWPNNIKAEVHALLPFSKEKYQNLFVLSDSTGYKLVNGNLVVFEEEPTVYKVVKQNNQPISFVPQVSVVANDGAMIITNNEFLYYRLIYKNGRWSFAQNKTEPNQTPLFEFYNSQGTSLETLNETDFRGGVILGFKDGNVYDPVLDKYIEVSSIDFDLINENSSGSVSPNQIKFFTEIDKSWSYIDSNNGEEITVSGPHGYAFANVVVSFYQSRRGLDITKQVQDLLYEPETEQAWSGTIDPPAESLNVIHVYFQPDTGPQFFTEIDGHGLVKLSSKKGYNRIEPLLPLKSGNEVLVICHNLPNPMVFYRTDLINNITTPTPLTAPYCINNGIRDGIIRLELSDSISLDGGATFIDNDIVQENTILYWSSFPASAGSVYKTAMVKPLTKWRFLQNFQVKDKTNPIYNEFEITVNDEVDFDGTLTGKQEIKATPSLLKKIADRDKITVASVLRKPVQRTAPLSLTVNPLNEKLSTLNYYSLYQHTVNLKSNATNSRDYIEFESLLQSSLLGTGTLLKHSSPISRFAVMATNMPYDLTDLLIKQGKHYDIFLQKLKTELEEVIRTSNYEAMSSYDLISLALENIFLTSADLTKFWAHSNMLGWGEQLDNYRETNYNVIGDFELTGEFEPISHRAGKNLLLQITYNGKLLVRRRDYTLLSLGDEYVRIQFAEHMIGKVVNIKQWYSRFMCQVPASLAKIGLAPVYMPEILEDTTTVSSATSAYFKVTDGTGNNDFVIKLTDPAKIQNARDQINGVVPRLHITGLIIKSTADYNPNYSYHYDPDTIDFFEVAMEVCDATFDYTEEYLDEAGGAFLPGLRLCPWNSLLVEEIAGGTTTPGKYFMYRHDGTRYYLADGVDADNRPNNSVENLLYEYELSVWANLEYDIVENEFQEIIEARPGYFRPKDSTFVDYHVNFVNDTNNWLTENNVYDNANTAYDNTNSFTAIYQLGSGDYNESTIAGSWRLIYKFVFDTDRPHTHPWEMLGYTIKPLWWDTYYSWTVPSKRTAMERALRTGRINSPAESAVINIAFARCNHKDILEKFPVDNSGNLLPPDHPDIAVWLEAIKLDETFAWSIGGFGPYEQVFASTHRGIAAMAKNYYIKAPALYVNRCWVPGQQVKNRWNQYVDRTTGSWQGCRIEHDYHRSLVNGEVVYTSGIESLYGEFCVLENIDFKSQVIDKFNNVVVNKEFLLQGFTNKDNVRIQSTSINSQRQTLFVPEENYQVRTVKHYPAAEKFYSGMRIVFDGTNYAVYGFNKEFAYFRAYPAAETSATTTIFVGDVRIKEKISYNKNTTYDVSYGMTFNNRFELYDFIIGYGKYLEDQGFVFDQPEGGDLRNWQLSAKQFIFWSNDPLAAGNYIDLNPAADYLAVKNMGAHLESLEGTDTNPGTIVDRLNKPLFGKDLLVSRNDGDLIIIRTKNSNRSVYGIKLTFSYYESVVHLDSTSVFDDVYFLPAQGTSKRSFALGGRKTTGWTGEYFVPGYAFTNDKIIPNFDSMTEQGRSLLDIESSVLDPVVRNAIKDQFGLSRNIELQQLFLQEDNEISFKNAITFNKGTVKVFNSLAPLTHNEDSSVTVNEEYMVRTGEFGNTENINFYEFELSLDDTKADYHDYQIVKFIADGEPENNKRIVYIKDDSNRWVYKPLNKNLRFKTASKSTSPLKSAGPLLLGDADYQIERIEDIDSLFGAYIDLWLIPHYDETSTYKTYDRVRYGGKLYCAKTTVSPNTWSNNNEKFTEIAEPALPNIYVNNYYKTNPDLGNEGPSGFIPGTWQILQTIDRSCGIVETCPGPSDVSKVRVSTNKPHGLTKGEYVIIVNCSSDVAVVDGIWLVESVEGDSKFYINTRIADTIKKGKIFALKPVRFKNINELNLATGSSADNYGYSWKKKYNPLTNALGETNIELDPTPSGYSQTYPIAIIDDGLNQNNPDVTREYGNYQVYGIEGNVKTLLKEESLPVDSSDIEQLIVYDYSANKTVVKVELYDPKKLIIPQVFKDDIDIISRVDPARYNRTTDEFKSVYTSLGWYEEMIGMRWWDTSTLSFNDYESGDETDRAKFWGTTFNNRTPDIYEWTKSPVHPKSWSGLVESKTVINGQLATGEVYVDKTLNEDNYHWVEEEDYQNGKAYTVYYFWVKNKNTISDQSKAARVYTTKQLSSYILNPSAAGIPWWSPISNNAMIIRGIEPYLNNNGTVVQIKKKTKGNEKHHQWTFIGDTTAAEVIPEWVHIRFRDSISAHIFYKVIGPYTDFSSANIYKQSDIVRYRPDGKFYVCRIHMTDDAETFDIYNEQTNPNGAWFELKNVFEVSGSLIGTWDGYFWSKIPWDYSLDKFWFWKVKNVPDSENLHRYNRLGNSVRPFIQSWFNNVLEARRTFIKRLNEVMVNVDAISIPNWGNTRLNDTTYEIADETADITKYWRYVDFKSEDFDPTKAVSVVLDTEADIYVTPIDAGEYIKINTGIKDYVIYEKNLDQSFSVVYRTKGAIEFDKILYDPVSLSSWDSAGWDKYAWDFDLNSVYNAIVDALRYEIFVGKYSKYYSTMICAMFRYVLSEQVNVDWLAKSSTIEPLNLIGKSLTADDVLKRDEITVLTNFYSTVKSYRDKVRGGTVNKNSADDVVTEIDESLVIRELDPEI